jgi:hypothetical protein
LLIRMSWGSASLVCGAVPKSDPQVKSPAL